MPTDNDILLLEQVHPVAADVLEEGGLSVDRIDTSPGPDELAGILSSTRMIGIRSKTRITRELIEQAPNLEAIGCFCIGTNQVDLDAAAARGIAVFNSPFSNTRSVAEMTLGEIIALHRRLFDKSMLMHRGEWNKSAASVHEVRGRTLGIIGYGHIGSQVSVLAESLGMRVIYYDTQHVMPLGNARSCPDLKTLLERSDVVTLHVPATPVTDRMIGREQLQLMKESAFLINNSRGSVVDFNALATVLRDGGIAGAAVDVFPEEPSSNQESFSCELTGVPNVILTPHVGGSTEEAQDLIAHEVADKLVRFATTGTTTTAVNVPEVELPARLEEQVRILHFHHNVPGVLSKMHAIIAEHDLNITAEYLRSNGALSYVIMDSDRLAGTDVLKRLQDLEETIRLRVLRS